MKDATVIEPPDIRSSTVNQPEGGDPLAQMGSLANRKGSGPGTGAGVFRGGGAVSAPVVLYKVDPEYTAEARQAKLWGTVVLQLIVDTNGHARNIRVVRSLGLGLDEKAIEALSQWKFLPGVRNGQPVAVQVTIEMNFRLL